jgi:hypothetical protein
MLHRILFCLTSNQYGLSLCYKLWTRKNDRVVLRSAIDVRVVYDDLANQHNLEVFLVSTYVKKISLQEQQTEPLDQPYSLPIVYGLV